MAGSHGSNCRYGEEPQSPRSEDQIGRGESRRRSAAKYTCGGFDQRVDSRERWKKIFGILEKEEQRRRTRASNEREPIILGNYSEAPHTLRGNGNYLSVCAHAGEKSGGLLLSLIRELVKYWFFDAGAKADLLNTREFLCIRSTAEGALTNGRTQRKRCQSGQSARTGYYT